MRARREPRDPHASACPLADLPPQATTSGGRCGRWWFCAASTCTARSTRRRLVADQSPISCSDLKALERPLESHIYSALACQHTTLSKGRPYRVSAAFQYSRRAYHFSLFLDMDASTRCILAHATGGTSSIHRACEGACEAGRRQQSDTRKRSSRSILGDQKRVEESC